MSLSRRQALAGAGGLSVLALGRAVQQGVIELGDASELRAWDDWNRHLHSGPLALVSAGLLAASPFNCQPWRFAIGRLGADVFDVPERGLGVLDPFGRGRLAGLGAAIHNMALASTLLGRAATVRLLPDVDDLRHVARIELDVADERGPPPHPLLGVIGRRHTHRGLWTGAPLGAEVLAALLDFPLNKGGDVGVVLFAAGGQVGRRFSAVTEEATAAMAEDGEMMAAAGGWWRHDQGEIVRRKDGLSAVTSGVSAWRADLARLGPERDAAARGRAWREMTRDVQLPSATVFGMIYTPAGRQAFRREALLAGAAWQRLHLLATSLGLAAQPLDQLAAMRDREQAVGGGLAFSRAAAALVPAGQLMMGFRLGRAAALAPASVRRPVSEVIGAPARLGYEVARAEAETALRDAQMERRVPEAGD